MWILVSSPSAIIVGRTAPPGGGFNADWLVFYSSSSNHLPLSLVMGDISFFCPLVERAFQESSVGHCGIFRRSGKDGSIYNFEIFR